MGCWSSVKSVNSQWFTVGHKLVGEIPHNAKQGAIFSKKARIIYRHAHLRVHNCMFARTIIGTNLSSLTNADHLSIRVLILSSCQLSNTVKDQDFQYTQNPKLNDHLREKSTLMKIFNYLKKRKSVILIQINSLKYAVYSV